MNQIIFFRSILVFQYIFLFLVFYIGYNYHNELPITLQHYSFMQYKYIDYIIGLFSLFIIISSYGIWNFKKWGRDLYIFMHFFLFGFLIYFAIDGVFSAIVELNIQNIPDIIWATLDGMIIGMMFFSTKISSKF